jgi:RNA polymerase sigma-70 factor (ECF subfamily)
LKICYNGKSDIGKGEEEIKKMAETGEFEQLYRENYAGIYRFLLKLCGDHYLAEELTQETFYQAILSLHRFRGGCEMFTWLASLAKHTYFKYLRKQKKREADIDLDAMLQYCRDLMSDSPEDIFLRKITVRNVREKMRELPAKYRDVMILRVYAELPFSQIGATLGITENSAKIIYFRAKKKLMEEIRYEIDL